MEGAADRFGSGSRDAIGAAAETAGIFPTKRSGAKPAGTAIRRRSQSVCRCAASGCTGGRAWCLTRFWALGPRWSRRGWPAGTASVSRVMRSMRTPRGGGLRRFRRDERPVLAGPESRRMMANGRLSLATFWTKPSGRLGRDTSGGDLTASLLTKIVRIST